MLQIQHWKKMIWIYMIQMYVSHINKICYINAIVFTSSGKTRAGVRNGFSCKWATSQGTGLKSSSYKVEQAHTYSGQPANAEVQDADSGSRPARRGSTHHTINWLAVDDNARVGRDNLGLFMWGIVQQKSDKVCFICRIFTQNKLTSCSAGR